MCSPIPTHTLLGNLAVDQRTLSGKLYYRGKEVTPEEFGLLTDPAFRLPTPIARQKTAKVTHNAIETPRGKRREHWITGMAAVLGVGLMVVAILLMLSACSSPEPYWSRPGATAEDFRREGAGCRNQARAIAAGSAFLHWLDIYDDCMRGHGWEKQ